MRIMYVLRTAKICEADVIENYLSKMGGGGLRPQACRWETPWRPVIKTIGEGIKNH